MPEHDWIDDIIEGKRKFPEFGDGREESAREEREVQNLWLRLKADILRDVDHYNTGAGGLEIDDSARGLVIKHGNGKHSAEFQLKGTQIECSFRIDRAEQWRYAVRSAGIDSWSITSEPREMGGGPHLGASDLHRELLLSFFRMI